MPAEVSWSACSRISWASLVCARTKTSPAAIVPLRLIVRPAVLFPLKYIEMPYAPAVRFTGTPVPLKISIALLFDEPSMYSEMKRSELTASARSARAPASAAIASRTSRPSVTKRARATANRCMNPSPLELAKTDVATLAGLGRESKALPCPELQCPRREAVPRHDVRLPDERPRLGADQGHAGGARTGGERRAGGRRRPGLQHVHDPREAGSTVRGAPRAGTGAQGARSREGNRGRRGLRPGAARAALRALPVRRRCLRAGVDPASR